METRLKDAEFFKEQTNAELLALRSTPKLNETNTQDLGTLEKLQEVNKYKIIFIWSILKNI